MGQPICSKTMPEYFENYECKENEVKLCVPLYNVETGKLRGLQKWLASIMVRGDEDQMFLSYGFVEDKSNVLYSSYKQILPNIFQRTSFKKHNPMLLNERFVQEHSRMFFFLPLQWTEKRRSTSSSRMYLFVQLTVIMKILENICSWQRFLSTGSWLIRFGEEAGCKRNCYKLSQRRSPSLKFKFGKKCQYIIDIRQCKN